MYIKKLVVLDADTSSVSINFIMFMHLPRSYPLPVKNLSSVDWGCYQAFGSGSLLKPCKNSTVIHPVANLDRLGAYSQYSKTLPNDVFILGHPRCGNHFLSKILVELIRLDGNNNNGKYKHHDFYHDGDCGNIRVPMLEYFVSAFDDNQINTFNNYKKDTLNFYYTHLHTDCLPFQQCNIDPKTKFIVLARNPKDSFTSGFLHHYAQNQPRGVSYDLFLRRYFTYFNVGAFGGGNYYDFYRKLWIEHDNKNMDNNQFHQDFA